MRFLVISLVLAFVGVIAFAYISSRPERKKYTYINEFGIPVTIEEVDRDWGNYVVQPPANYTMTDIDEIPDPEVVVETLEWVEKNLYKVESYTEREDGLYDVTLVNIEPAQEYPFDDLREVFLSIPYANENNYLLINGVNCQGMTCYIADWCSKNDHEYAIEYFKTHVAIRVLHRDQWYRFNFVSSPSITILDE